MRKPTLRRWVAVLVLPAILSACGVIGPGSIEQGRSRYNEAVHDTGAEQLLLNIARINKNELPLSMLVTSILATVSPGATASANAAGLGIGKKSGAFRQGSLTSGTVGAGISYSEPTSVQYQPLSGQSLVAQLTTPVSVNLIANLLDSSWPPLSVLQITTGQLSGPGDGYGMALNMIAELYQAEAIDILPTASSDPPSDEDAGKPRADLAAAVGKLATAMKPAKGPDAITLFFRPPPAGDCTAQRDAWLFWSRLLMLFQGTQTSHGGSQDGADWSKVTGLPRQLQRQHCESPAELAKVLRPVKNLRRIEIRSKAVMSQPKPASKAVDWAGRLLQTYSAYAILKSAEKSDWTPAELIDVVPAEFYQRIKAEPWNSGQDFYTFLRADICSRSYAPESHDGTDTVRCMNLDNPDKQPRGDPSLAKYRRYNATVDATICQHRLDTDPVPADCRPVRALAGAPRSPVFSVACTDESDIDCMKEQDNLNQRRRLILVQYSETRPADAFKMVFKDGYYYFIGATDFISQKNFALLALIEDVQAVAPSGPIGTSISVGG